MKHSSLDSLSPNDPEDCESTLTRRHFVSRVGLGVLGLAMALPGAPRSVHAATPVSDSVPVALLEKSGFVYISPIQKNGKESSCHAELWFAWIDDSIVVTVAKDRWKATALDRGLDSARIWVGDHGRWNTMFGGHNEAFLGAPNFLAKAEQVKDDTMIERLLAVYDKKYPNEIATWRDKMRSGNADGSRIMIQYRPDPKGPR